MVNRIRIEPGIFRLSKPGIDVMTAGQTQLMFDGDWPGSGKFIKGSISGSRSGTGNSNHTVAFGKTFSNVPTVFVNVIGDSGVTFPGVAFPMASVSGGSTGLTNFTFAWSVFRLTVRLADMSFRVGTIGEQTSISYTIEYAVLDYRVGF